MTTILLEKNKKENKKQYFFSYLSRFFGSLIIVAIIFIVFQATIYYSIQFEKRVLEEDNSFLEYQAKKYAFEKYKNTITEVEDFLEVFNYQNYSKGEILDLLFEYENNQIIISNLSIEESDDISYVRFEGISSSRDSLLELKEQLENNEKIQNVNLPPSSFTKTFDIPFKINFDYKYE
jgi:hypothetical protein